MSFNGEKVKQMALQKRIKAKDVREAVFPERSGNFSWDEITSKKSNPKATTIEAIADLLQCPIDDLFDRAVVYSAHHVTGNNNSVGNVSISSDPDVLLATISHLRDVIERQDKVIAEQNKRIDQLIELAKH